MKPLLEQTEVPPAYAWGTREVLSFCTMATLAALFVLAGLLWFSNFDDILLFVAGCYSIYYVYKELPMAVSAWLMKRELRRELDQHGKD